MFRTIRSSALAVVAVWLAPCCLPCSVHGQTTVNTGEDRVVVDGSFVRIESPEGVTEVSGDWRRGGRTSVSHTADILADLGAAEADDHIHLTLAGDILFEFGSAAISEASQQVLTNVADVIRDRALGEVLVIGHTDSVGGAEANLRLSRDRAAEVIRWLHHNQGIPGHMLVGNGMGASQPVAHNTTPDGRDDPAGRARNRRVELFLATTENADVRAAAGLTVRSPAGDVHIQEDRVEVGGVVVDEGGVRIGGTTISTVGAIHTGGLSSAMEDSTTCSAGRHCRANCPEGDCRMACSAGAVCDYGCLGGGCDMQCAAGATCRFSCPGGDCLFTCAVRSGCDTSCAGGGCTGG